MLMVIIIVIIVSAKTTNFVYSSHCGVLSKDLWHICDCMYMGGYLLYTGELCFTNSNQLYMYIVNTSNVINHLRATV